MSRKVVTPIVQCLMIVLLASPLAYAYSGYFYVIPSSAPLRECAAPECEVLSTAYQGDKVEILERTSTGWSRVRVVDRSLIGWIRSDWLSFSPDLKAKQPPHYYVNISSLPLRDGPSPSANVIATLNFNSPVEMLGVTSGYAQVRELQTSKVGWVLPRYISSSPLISPQSPHRRTRARKPAPKEEKAPEETPAPPKAM